TGSAHPAPHRRVAADSPKPLFHRRYGHRQNLAGVCIWTLSLRLGFSVRYLRLPRLFEQLRIAHGDGSYLRLLQLWAKTDLLILADWGLDTLALAERKDLLELMDDRHGLHSTLITSQLPLEHWHTYLGEPTMADAILDRLLHNAHKIHLKGESMRKTSTTLTQRDHAE